MSRLAVRISLVMLLGVVTSVAVAWGCAWRAQHMQAQAMSSQVHRIAPTDPDASYAWYFRQSSAVGYVRVRHFWDEAYNYVPDFDGGEPWNKVRRTPTGCISTPRPPVWVKRAYTDPTRIGSESVRGAAVLQSITPHDCAAGWPLLCTRSEYERIMTLVLRGQKKSVEWPSRAGFVVQVRASADGVVLLPYAPIWPGLLANTAIYGSAWWATLFGPGMLIRWRRRRAGRCAKCGYDLRGAVVGDQSSVVGVVCPECGADPT